MMNKKIWITEQDRQRIKECLAALEESPDKRDAAHIRELDRELDRAEIILDPKMTPHDVITMRSRVQLWDLSTMKEMEYTLVYPSEQNPQRGRISVLASLGTAMLGYRVGDTFDVTLPRGTVSFRVEALPYQPEAAGDYHL